jgi:hypothetical protein
VFFSLVRSLDWSWHWFGFGVAVIWLLVCLAVGLTGLMFGSRPGQNPHLAFGLGRIVFDWMQPWFGLDVGSV